MTTKVSRISLILLSLGVFLATSDTAFAAKRIALVIGNGAYESISPLDNPPGDARLMAETLTKTGFQVASHLDVDSITMMPAGTIPSSPASAARAADSRASTRRAAPSSPTPRRRARWPRTASARTVPSRRPWPST